MSVANTILGADGLYYRLEVIDNGDGTFSPIYTRIAAPTSPVPPTTGATTRSGVHTFTLNAAELIREALELTATIDMGSAVPPEIMESCMRSLNLYIKAWQAKGLFLHTYQPAILPLVTNQQSYLLGPDGDATEEDGITAIIRPLKIDDVRLLVNGTERPLFKMSGTEYNELTNKNISSQPNNYSYDPQLDNSRLYVWPVASDNEQILLFTYQKPVDDFTGDTDTATAPADWLQCLTLGLAYTIAPKLSVPMDKQAGLQKRYNDALADLDDFEETSIYFQPWRRQ